MVGLIGRKVGMTSIYTTAGERVPVTVLALGPCRVIQKKTKAHDGYEAVQLGYEPAKSVTKPRAGHLARHGGAPLLRHLREFRLPDSAGYEVGQELTVSVFDGADFVDIRGTSKGKGFAGVIKRHHFAGGDGSHGSMFHRAPGSIGASSFPSRVWKGKRLPGRMGNETQTSQKLKVMKVDADQGVLLVRGAVPGPARGLVEVRVSKRSKTAKAAATKKS